MSEYQDHIRRSLDGAHEDQAEELGIDEMRWSPTPTGEPVTHEVMSAADTAHALLDRAADAYLSLLDSVLGDGEHHMVVSAAAPHGELTEVQQLALIGDTVVIDEAAAMRVCAVIAAGMLGCGGGGLVVRTYGRDGSESVRGWKIWRFWLRPLTAEQIREAYSVDPTTGARLELPLGVEYRQAEHVPLPAQNPAGGSSACTAPRDNRPANRRN
ncbi:hypothetical protein [Streptomyces melanogenes]|uniref:hypothetical protein n=1 Tax=Streptomyces melanogenes TaxID=67326 RepID=UPI00167C5B45|nr:hypothetical protein [Streptomyces melanogenes]GGP92994.1 hypothetical protein GCM10010278_83710 [Streptomyces melanogenes]